VSQIFFDLPCADNVQKDCEQKAISKNSRKSVSKPSRNQIEFKVACLDELIPEDHRARDVWEFTSKLDFSDFLDEIKIPEGCGGPKTKDPRVLMALWLLATLEGVYSARQIDRLCKEHHAYIWICGGVTMNYHSLSDFRTSGADKFRTLLQESIAIIWQSGIWQPETIAQDGTRVKANAGSGLFKKEATLGEYLKEANEHIAKLEKELEENPGAFSAREKAAKQRAARERKERVENAQADLIKHRKTRATSSKINHNTFTKKDSDNLKTSLVEPESRKMKMGDGGFRAAFNVQFATSTDKKVIVGVDVVNTLDPGTLVPMMQQVAATFAKIGCLMAKDWLADSAYANKKDAADAEETHPDVTLYSPPVSNNKHDALTPRHTDNEAMIRLRKRMGTEEAQAKYKERSCTAEFANASTKNYGMREFLVRGLEKVKQTALLYAITHNMMIYFRYCCE
jgi:transposase